MPLPSSTADAHGPSWCDPIDHDLVVGAGQVAHDVVRLDGPHVGGHGQAHPHRTGRQQVAQPGAVAAADVHAGQRALLGVVGHVVLVRVAGVPRERADEGGGPRLLRGAEHVAEVGRRTGSPARPASVPSGSTERLSAVVPSGTLPWVAMKLPRQAQQAHVVQRRLAGHRRGAGGVERGQLEVEAAGRGRRREGTGKQSIASAVPSAATTSSDHSVGSQRSTSIGSSRTSSSPISRNRSAIHPSAHSSAG